jgi:hypothetical protein
MPERICYQGYGSSPKKCFSRLENSFIVKNVYPRLKYLEQNFESKLRLSFLHSQKGENRNFVQQI